VGFGISSRDDVVWFNKHSDGAVVGSSIIKNMDGKSDPINATELLIKILKGNI
jgi:tryptophan synthase alpha subunit